MITPVWGLMLMALVTSAVPVEFATAAPSGISPAGVDGDGVTRAAFLFPEFWAFFLSVWQERFRSSDSVETSLASNPTRAHKVLVNSAQKSALYPVLTPNPETLSDFFSVLPLSELEVEEEVLPCPEETCVEEVP